MTFTDWLNETKQRYQNNSAEYATKESARELAIGALRNIGQRWNYGESIWHRDWDVLLVLDACRADLFEQQYGDDARFESLDRFTSVGSHSSEWMQKTFADAHADELANTAYITGNPFSEQHADPNRFLHLEEVWQYAWDDEMGTIHPDPLTDAAIRAHRDLNPDRLIVHYMQPHAPYVTQDLTGGWTLDEFGDHTVSNAFDVLKRGGISKEDHWQLYEENLDYVMENICDTLLTSIDAETVVLSADHGNSFGKYGIYGHPAWVPLPSLKTVPWAVTSATDDGTYDPPEKQEQASSDLQDKLRDLGYMG